MHGNVWEWCGDSKRKYEKKKVEDPICAATVESRAIRGGCWDNRAGSVRCASRLQNSPGIQSDYLGFRLVRVQE